MKNTILFFAAIGIFAARAQSTFLNAAVYGGPGNDDAAAMSPTADGGFILAGKSGIVGGDVTANGGCDDFWLVKLQENGTLEWQESIPLEGCQYIRDIVPTQDQGYVVLGQFGTAPERVRLMKLNSVLDVQWEYSVDADPALYTTGVDLLQANDGGYLMSGYMFDGLFPPITAFFIKLDSQGSFQWEHIEESANGDARITPCQDGTFLLSAAVEYIPGNIAPQVIKVDSDGNILWTQLYDQDMYFHSVNTITETSDGGFVASSTNYSDTPLFYNLNIMKADPEGNLQWIRANDGSPLMDFPVLLQEMPNGGFLGVAYSYDSSAGDIYVFQADADGYITDEAYYGGSGPDQPTDAIFDGAQLYLAGATASNNGNFSPGNGMVDAFFMKIGVLLSTPGTANRPSQIWPNPAVSELNIPFEFSSAEIIDIAGKNIRHFGYAPQIDLSGIAAGSYLVRLQTPHGLRVLRFLKK